MSAPNFRDRRMICGLRAYVYTLHNIICVMHCTLHTICDCDAKRPISHKYAYSKFHGSILCVVVFSRLLFVVDGSTFVTRSIANARVWPLGISVPQPPPEREGVSESAADRNSHPSNSKNFVSSFCLF